MTINYANPINIGNPGPDAAALKAALRDAIDLDDDLALKLNRAGGFMSGPIVMTGPSNTTTRGLMYQLNGPTTGSFAGPFNFNQIAATWRAEATGAGLPGNPGSATVVGSQFNLTVGGPNLDGVSFMAAAVGLIHDQDDTSEADKLAFGTGVYSNSESPGKIYGSSFSFTVDDGGVTPQAIGTENDVFINGTGQVTNALGFHAWSGGENQADEVYSAYGIGVSGAAGSAQWKSGFCLYTAQGATGTPIEAAGSLFVSDHTTQIANIFDFENVDVTGSILKFPHVHLSGHGTLNLGSTVEAGGIGVAGPASTALFATFEQDGDPKWQLGIGANSDVVFVNSTLSNVGFRIASATNAITALGTINGATIDETAWTAFTPTITAGSGAITTYTSSGKYKRLFGRTIIACVRATLTAVGTASGALLFTLPVNAVAGTPVATVHGRESGTTGKGIAGAKQSPTLAYCYLADGTSVFAGGNGSVIDVTITYEAAA